MLKIFIFPELFQPLFSFFKKHGKNRANHNKPTSLIQFYRSYFIGMVLNHTYKLSEH